MLDYLKIGVISKSACVLLLSFLLLACSKTNPEITIDTTKESKIESMRETPAPGVALELAEQRLQSVSGLVYDLQLSVPREASQALLGNIRISLNVVDTGEPLVLDFRAPADHVFSLSLDDADVDYSVTPDHIVIPASAFTAGDHEIQIEFQSTDAALNRNEDFLYALFVPDRASTAFPVFEQPSLKARFNLTLDIPAEWEAVSNGAQLSREESTEGRHSLRFDETLPISTYLFSFAVGELQVDSAERDGRQLVMYHRETDAEKYQRNRDAIFDLHATALTWLEEYTGIPYPFDKFAFFAVPSFQFGGMEHPGAIWYRASSLFLDPTASRTQELRRASLIAHETAHMWFGDLVTMRWFNDVWMKEVFANFMAAKIAGPAFPDLNLPLRFFQAHHPTAYNVDRTEGTNPIRQPLENLSDAGSLYGAIIYQKAPVVVQQLEQLIGEDQLREGLRLYLQQFPYGNATWSDLVTILDSLSEQDLQGWSEVWVNETGRPRISSEWGDGGVTIRQADSNAQRNQIWNQPVVLAVAVDGEVSEYRVQMEDSEAFLPLEASSLPDFIIAGADGIGYGRFVLDDRSRNSLLGNIHQLENPIHRSVAWQTLFEEVLEGTLTAVQFMDAATIAVEQESDELLIQQVLGLLRNVYWQFLKDGERRAMSLEIETSLWEALDRAVTPGRKGPYFSTLLSVTLSEDGVSHLQRIWQGDETPEGLPLQEQQYINLAEALALRNVEAARNILDIQEQRITNPDRLARFQFVRPALSADATVRASLFRTFTDVRVRRRESWVLNAMSAIHHPIRNEESIALLADSLNLVEEIQRTGDIFFPLNWLNATLGGYSSSEAAGIVDVFLEENPELAPRLRGKVLQAVDDLYRAVDLDAAAGL
ncbi:MAG: hypothetical protein HOF74_09300 [Gammaproteobacteria bacterium]|jgi:aminopeptidase N|nr:hypothetical protein [Gammaproteobacteria bacterium]MBT3860012.1 hypothetical protein [Gammaproteobacteria bacterium]MBT3987038.1 hypothetical protein [Gammaproteobacteria bacterium]MBT4256971.1 hypothetical protein [Gammaproteobacteria bacterium]MBT4580697.1 hypothetical protein [Gammaproteobacteria bacterium]